jgi:hypothetical protein
MSVALGSVRDRSVCVGLAATDDEHDPSAAFLHCARARTLAD